MARKFLVIGFVQTRERTQGENEQTCVVIGDLRFQFFTW